MPMKPVTAIIVGAGHRAMVYSELALTHPDMLKIVGVADPNPVRRRKAQELYGFGDDMCFEDAAELASRGRLAADFVKFVRGEEPSLACTSIFDSMIGHMTVYRADASREDGGVPKSLTDI